MARAALAVARLRVDGKPTDADAPFLDGNDGTMLKVRLYVRQVLEYQSSLHGRSPACLPSKQDHGRGVCSLPCQQFTEVRIRRDDHTIMQRGMRKNLVVRGIEPQILADVDCIVSSLAEPRSKYGRHAGIDQKSHPGVRRGSSRSRTASAA